MEHSKIQKWTTHMYQKALHFPYVRSWTIYRGGLLNIALETGAITSRYRHLHILFIVSNHS